MLRREVIGGSGDWNVERDGRRENLKREAKRLSQGGPATVAFTFHVFTFHPLPSRSTFQSPNHRHAQTGRPAASLHLRSTVPITSPPRRNIGEHEHSGWNHRSGLAGTSACGGISRGRRVSTGGGCGAAQFATIRSRVPILHCAALRDAREIIDDEKIDAVSICLPNDLHASVATAALKAGKHVLCETPPAQSLADAKKMAAAAEKSGRTLLYAAQRRFGGAEQAAQQAIAKGYVGDVRHARTSSIAPGHPRRHRLVHRQGAIRRRRLLDLGLPVLDLAWSALRAARAAERVCDRFDSSQHGRDVR